MHSVSTTPDLTYISLGAGVQSTALLIMAARRLIEPMPDFAIFSDTGGEPVAVYAHLRRLRKWAKSAGIPVVLVQYRNLADDTLRDSDFIRIPAFVEGRSGKAAILRRQCTERYKIEPIKRYVRNALGAKTSKTGAILRPPSGRVAEQWIGFSLDEVDRINDHRHAVPYIRNRYPLMDLRMTRQDCIEWLVENGWPDVEKSACTFCPYHSDDEWIRMRDSAPDDWHAAVEFDRTIRERSFKGPQKLPYLHRDLLPLSDVVLIPGRGSSRSGCSPHGCRTMDRAEKEAA